MTFKIHTFQKDMDILLSAFFSGVAVLLAWIAVPSVVTFFLPKIRIYRRTCIEILHKHNGILSLAVHIPISSIRPHCRIGISNKCRQSRQSCYELIDVAYHRRTLLLSWFVLFEAL